MINFLELRQRRPLGIALAIFGKSVYRGLVMIIDGCSVVVGVDFVAF